VASGCRREETQLIADDAVALWEAAGQPKTLDLVCPQRFEAALSPTQAARREGKAVDVRLLRVGARCWEDDCDLLIVEGAGGLMSPLARGVLNIDLAKQFDGAKLIIVAANRLGAIHQTLATCAAAKHSGIHPAGIVLCQVDRVPDASAASNAREIAEYTDVPVLGTVDHDAGSQEIAFIDDLFV
jgi:dethiobiotin synthetase